MRETWSRSCFPSTLQLVADAREHGVRGELRGARDEHRRHEAHRREHPGVFRRAPKRVLRGGLGVRSPDDGQKFDFFCNAALEFLLQTGRNPDILHCHDWSTATVASAYWSNYHNYGLWKPKVVFTIHNMNYGQQKIGEASFHSQLTTTVSPSYAGEVSGHPAVRDNLHKFHGVRNGIDTEIWDPSTDQFLPMNYSADNHEDGKRAREEIQGRFGLTWGSDQPMVAVVSRLTAQKGLDLIKHAIGHSVKRGAQFVLLGSAPDPRVQGDFNAMAGAMGAPTRRSASPSTSPCRTSCTRRRTSSWCRRCSSRAA